MISASIVKALLSYEEETGKFFWKSRGCPAWDAAHVGKKAGCKNKDGYLWIKILGRSYQAHRVAWLYVYGVWPDRDLDHINLQRDDNRISNLRAATRSQNCANAPLRKDNTSGFKGVQRDGVKWKAQITVRKKVIYLGRFDLPGDAAAAYEQAATLHFGAFARVI